MLRAVSDKSTYRLREWGSGEYETVTFVSYHTTGVKTGTYYRPFDQKRQKAEFELWAQDCAEGRWKIIDTYRIAFELPGDAVLAYLTFR